MESKNIPNTPTGMSLTVGDGVKNSNNGNQSNLGRVGIKKPADMNGGTKNKTKKKKVRTELEEMGLLEASEKNNMRLFAMIDSMHLSKLNEIVVESQTKLRSVVANMAQIGGNLDSISHDLQGELREEVDEFERIEQSSQMLQSKMYEASETNSARELMTSEMVSETPGEQPRMIKKLVNFQDLSLVKIREVVNQQRNILDSLLNSIREIVSKINPMEIGYLNIKGKQPLEELFTVIFELLYDEAPDKFIWKNFKLTVLLREEGSADFLQRMANFEVKNVSKDLIEKVRLIKDSEELRGYLEDPKVGETLIDIADWLEFVYHGNALSKELVAMEDLHTHAKHMVEVLERNGRKLQYIKNLKQQRIKDEETAQEFVVFIADKVKLMHDNYVKSKDKLMNHITYQQELVAHIVQQENLKNQAGEGEIDTEEHSVHQQALYLPIITKPNKTNQ